MVIEFFALIVLILILLVMAIRINKQWEKAIILRLGKYNRVQGAGLFLLIPFIEKLRRVDVRTQVMNVEPQGIITSDSVTVEVDAIVYYKIKEAESEKAILNVEDWEYASTKLAQTTLRDIIGKHDLDDLLTKKSVIGDEIQAILDRATDSWGITIESVEIKDVNIPTSMERAMAKEAEATREKRARITKASGEFEASMKLKQAGEMLAKNRNALTLRQLQTWQEIGAEQNSLIIVVPTDIVSSGKDLTGLMALGKGELEKMPVSQHFKPAKKPKKGK